LSIRVSGKTQLVDTDILIIGGGFAGCGAAYEAKYWGRKLKVTVVEKANIERSGAVAHGLSAINLYVGMRWNENNPEDFVRYARSDLVGLVREDLLYDIARHVDSTVHLFEEWGLPMIYDEKTGHYKREGRWQIMIHGESYKPIVAEAARRSADEVYNRVMVTHLLTDPANRNRIAGAVGFSVRDGRFYVFRAKAVIVAAGGASHIYRPRSIGEGAGRTWYPPWNNGSAYALVIQTGATMTQLENKLVVTRFKDGYGPVGFYFLALKAVATNVYGEEYEKTKFEDLRKLVGKWADAKPLPTCFRNHIMLQEIKEGRGPIYIHTERVTSTPEAEEAAWEDFLDMTIGQVSMWAANNIDPKEKPSELMTSEPYVMGSHAVGAGAWVSGPADVAPKEYFWGYNRMTTVEGLFGAGDTVGGSPHKFSSGSFTEGRLAGKAAVKYVLDHPDYTPALDQKRVEELRDIVFRPLDNYHVGKNMVVKGSVAPNYIFPNQGLNRLEKLMDEYAGGVSTFYVTNEFLLNRALELLGYLKQDLGSVAAENLHHLQRAWELSHRVTVAEAVVRHTLFRRETRWPGYYYRADYPKIDDDNWFVFTLSRYDPASGDWQMETKPVIRIVE
jgi:adenylylsulfate reductase subunit A